jgi:uncharacterized surface protein with fasciclin (FAS1) repeats
MTIAKFATLVATASAITISGLAYAATSVMVGGAPMMSDKVIAENASNAKNLTTLVAAVKAAGLVDTLAGAGPFTVFAPTNDAFAKLPAGTVDKLVEPAMKSQLTGILTYHVVAGKMTAADLAAAIKAGGGKAILKTVAGGPLTAEMKGGKLVVLDANGGTANVETADVLQSNGVVHVIDTVLMPKS